MPDQPPLADDVTTLLETLSHAQLVEIARKAALDGLQGICRRELGDRILSDFVTSLFPSFSRAQVAEVTTRIGLTAIRNACWHSIANRRGPWQITIRCPDHDAALALRTHRGPAILVYWHFGPVNMMPLGFRRIGVAPLIVTRARPSRWTMTDELRVLRLVVTDRDPRQNAAVLRRSLKHLKEGGKVAIAIDGSLGRRDVAVPFLGRRFALSRGTAVMARITGASIIPCVMQWEPADWSMAIRVFDPLPRPVTPSEDHEAFEQSVLLSAAQCFEAFGRQHPEQFRIDQLADLAACPIWDSSGTQSGK